MNQNNRTYFVKPSHPKGLAQKFDPVLVNHNRFQGIGTTLLLDANVLINIERVVKSGNKAPAVKESGLRNLVSLLRRCPPKSVSISPGFALNEMPPGKAEGCRQAFEQFCARHLPAFVDTPDCIQVTYEGKVADYGFFDLEPEAQALLAIPFASLIYLQLLYRRQKLQPIEKFEQYLSLLECKMNMLSAKEIEIARYCFANPPATSREMINICRIFRKNFVQTKKEKLPQNVEQILHVAFNGACDLTLINAANSMDGDTLMGIPQDCWIATNDAKLAEFAELSHYVNMDGEAGKYITTTLHPEHHEDIYWFRSSTMFGALNLHRQANRQERIFNAAELCNVARRAADYAAESFA